MAERIENNRSRRPLLICWDSKYLGFYEMFRPKNMDIQYIKADQEEIVLAFGGLNCRKKEVIIERDGQRFLCSSPAKNMRRLLEAGQTDINFYSYISECVGVKNTENPVLPVVSTEVVHRVEEKVEQMGLGKKFVIFAPETNSLVEIRPEFWNALARKLCANGYDIFQNIYLEYDDALKIEGAKSADMTIEEMFVLAQKSSGIISLGSGLAVFLTAAGVQMDLIYTKLNNYSPALIIHIYSVLHLPGVSPELVKEYDTDKLEESELLDEILKRY
ncbi:MAG: hypothetical protein LBB13_03135 [Rickettsiales bacterium]|nr:hypothetical protein [Rickettsiales bacterium]